MECIPGHCIKCGGQFADNSGMAWNFNEQTIHLKDGNELRVGICVSCNLSDVELQEAVDAVNRSFERHGSPYTSMEADRLGKRKTYADLIHDANASTCAVCSKPVGENWIITNGQLRHEKCTPPRPWEGRPGV